MIKMILMLICLSAAFGIFLVAPRMFCRADRTPFLNMRWYAHRGLFDNCGSAPENSVAAFRKAVAAGYGIELDVQLSKDHRPVVFHDATLERMCGVKGNVWDFTFAELRQFRLGKSAEKIPAFEEVLETAAGKVPLIVEYKLDRPSVEVCRRCNAILKNYSGAYCIESFHPKALLWYRRHRPDVVRGQLSDEFQDKNYTLSEKAACKILTCLLTNVATRPDFIAYNHRYESNPSRRLCRTLGAMSAAYTIKSREQYEKVKDAFDVFIFDGWLPQ